MIAAVILGLALVTPAFTLPLTTQDSITGGASGTYTTQSEGTHNVILGSTQGEKTGIQGTYTQGNYQDPQTVNPVNQYAGKTGVQSSSGNYANQKYDGVETANPQKESFEPSNAYTYSNKPVADQTQQTGVRPEFYASQQYQENQALPKVQEQANVQQTQEGYSQQQQQQPVLPSVQQLSAVPVSPVLTPVVRPLETVAAGRIIIMAVEPIPQSVNPQDVISDANSNKEILYQTVSVQSQVPEVSQQVLSVRPGVTPYSVEKQQGAYQQPETHQVQTQVYDPQQQQQQQQQQPLTRSQTQVNPNFEKQTSPQSTPVQTQSAESSQQQQPSDASNVDQRQTAHTNYPSAKSQTSESTSQLQGLNPQQTVQKQVPSQVENSFVQKRPVESLYQQQQEQVYANQQVVAGQANKQVPCDQLSVLEQGVYKAQESNQNQYEGIQSQGTSYTGTKSAVFGDRIPQQQQQYPSKTNNQTPVQPLTTGSFNPVQSVPESSVVVQQQQVPSQ